MCFCVLSCFVSWVRLFFLHLYSYLQVPPLEHLHERYNNAWSTILTPREQANLYVHLWVLLDLIGKHSASGSDAHRGQTSSLAFVYVFFRLEELGQPIATAQYFWDLTNNVTYTYWKHKSYQNCFPCLLRGHRLWSVSRQRLSLNYSWLRFKGCL